MSEPAPACRPDGTLPPILAGQGGVWQGQRGPKEGAIPPLIGHLGWVPSSRPRADIVMCEAPPEGLGAPRGVPWAGPCPGRL